MRFSVENTCDKQVIKCKTESSIFAEGTDILIANFAFIIVGHGFGGRFRGLVSNFGNEENGEDHRKEV